MGWDADWFTFRPSWAGALHPSHWVTEDEIMQLKIDTSLKVRVTLRIASGRGWCGESHFPFRRAGGTLWELLLSCPCIDFASPFGGDLTDANQSCDLGFGNVRKNWGACH